MVGVTSSDGFELSVVLGQPGASVSLSHFVSPRPFLVLVVRWFICVGCASCPKFPKVPMVGGCAGGGVVGPCLSTLLPVPAAPPAHAQAMRWILDGWMVSSVNSSSVTRASPAAFFSVRKRFQFGQRHELCLKRLPGPGGPPGRHSISSRP